MTVTQAVHLIEQFASQAPFAVWITDSRGVSIFANRKLHEIFDVPQHPSGALGFSLFDDPGIAALGLADMARKAHDGEVIDAVIDIPNPESVETRVEAKRKDPLTIRVNCYALRSSSQAVEHYVILISDVTETNKHREELKTQLHDLAIYNNSRGSRLARVDELHAEIDRLEKAIRGLGADPVA